LAFGLNVLPGRKATRLWHFLWPQAGREIHAVKIAQLNLLLRLLDLFAIGPRRRNGEALSAGVGDDNGVLHLALMRIILAKSRRVKHA